MISLSGELDLATVPELEVVLDELDVGALHRVALDLSRLSFIDARGLRGVLRLHEMCVSHWITLRIRPGPKAVQRVFDLTGTRHALPFVACEEG
jgi:anti-anti-sigma factor